MTPLFPRKSIANHISNIINIGFHPYGPTMMLSGVMSTQRKVFLIDHISTAVMIDSGDEEDPRKEFDWFTLQPHSALESGMNIVNSPMKFILSPGEPYEYNIMFVDNKRYAAIKGVVLNIISSWKLIKEQADASCTPEDVFRSFIEMPMIEELNTVLQGLCYWKAGEYELEIRITTKADPVITYKKFFLEEPHIEQLKANAKNIIAAACDQPNINYNIATVDLF